MGNMIFDTVPPGAEVRLTFGAPGRNIEERILGQSPTPPCAIPEGSSVTVLARLEGYEDFVEGFYAPPGDSKRTLKLRSLKGDTPTPPKPAPPGQYRLASITVRNRELEPVRIILKGESGATVVSREVMPNREVKLSGNIGRSFTYLIEWKGKGYMDAVSSDDVAIDRRALPIQFPGAALKLSIEITDYV